MIDDDNRAQSMHLELEELIKEIDQLKENTKPIAPSVSLGRLTRMDAIVTKGVNQAVLQDALKRKEDLEQAIQKLDTGDYGLCQECGKGIAPARLEFIPEAKTCMNCASK